MINILTILLFLIVPLFFPSPLQELKVTKDTFDPVIIEEKPIPEELILEQMSIEEKVGQLFIFGFDGTTLSKEEKNFLQETHAGGALLLGKNISSEEQLIQLIKEIQNTKEISLFISIDQEGGIVSRIKWNDILIKSQSEIDGPKEAYATAKERGEILKGYGINMNLAPVAEYITDSSSFLYNRVYRGSREEVIEKSVGALEGYTAAGIISVPKHYPGHSNTSPDSHLSLPVVNVSKDDWNNYILPFSEILKRTNVDGIMVGHIKYTNIDYKNPASLSSEIINTRLIHRLGYQGLVISDDMEMSALEGLGTSISIAKKAFEAGNDILIYSKYSNDDPTIQRDVYEYIVKEVKNGNINIDEKVLKILRMKIKYKILNPENI